MLGLYYINSNINKAYLCMEMAYFYCDDDNDREVIRDMILDIKTDCALRVRNVSVMILSYNDPDILEKSIEAVERYQPSGSFEIVVVDNDSSDERTKQYLRDRKDAADYPFKLIENSENLGFSKGCNIGAKACSPDNDIFFLNNDAVLCQNSLFFLRMGLYDNRNVGATGAMSNSASLQEIDERELIAYADGEAEKKAIEENNLRPWHKVLGYERALELFMEYAKTKCIPMRDPFVKRFRLTGFAVLVSREALSTVAKNLEVFDESFTPAYFEDDDLGIRIARAGYYQYLCVNSLIYHNGGSGFAGHPDAMEEGRKKFADKWGFDIWGYSLPWFEVADRAVEIAKSRKGRLRIIDFSCGFGANASYIKGKCPDVYIAGVCRNGFEAGIAGLIADEVTFGELNTLKLPWKCHSFDVVIAEKEFVSRGRISECLAEGGIYLGDQEDNL
jgi:GT2 family glycosyltransferase